MQNPFSLPVFNSLEVMAGVAAELRTLGGRVLNIRAIDAITKEASKGPNIDSHRDSSSLYSHEESVLSERVRSLEAIGNILASQIRKLEECRALVNQRVRLDRALLARWRRLPRELLSEIFVLALPDKWTDSGAWRRGINFAEVCHAWREVALFTPRLWARFVAEAVSGVPPQKHTATMENLKRSAQVPLELWVGTFPWWDEPPLDTEGIWRAPLWDAVSAQSHRWQRATIKRIPLAAFDSQPGLSFRTLRYLDVALLARQDQQRFNLPLSFFANAPTLHTLTISYIRTPALGVRVALPSSWRLQVLDIKCRSSAPPLVVCIDAILSCSQTLRKCRVDTTRAGALPDNPPTTVFPVLEELSLLNKAILLCPFMVAPSVKTARLIDEPIVNDMGDDSVVWPVTLFAQLLDRSSAGTSLRSLVITVSQGTIPQGLIACLRRVPHLMSFEMHEEHWRGRFIPPISRDILAALKGNASLRRRRLGSPTADSDEDDILLPHLTHLTVATNGERYSDAFSEALRKALVSQRQLLVWRGEQLPGLLVCRTDYNWKPEASDLDD